MTPILYVEDDPNDVLFLQRALQKAVVANPIHNVTDGQQAIDYLQGAGKFADRKQYPLPGLVLLDLKLPYVMGLEVLRWIRQQPQTPPVVIVLTASAEDADIAAAYRLGANAFLVKPSEASKLEEMVQAIKDFWLMHNTLPQESCRERAAAPAASRSHGPEAKPTGPACHAPTKSTLPASTEQQSPFQGTPFFEKELKCDRGAFSLFARDSRPDISKHYEP
jgi:two-component system response regulator